MKFSDVFFYDEGIKDRLLKRASSTFEHGSFIMGDEVLELEEELSKYTKVKNVISCASGTDALILALKAKGVGAGDVVFCPDFTFFATSEAIDHCGATTVLVDVDRKTFNICPDDLERKIKYQSHLGKNLKGVIVVDLFGAPADYDKIKKICDSYSLFILEDGAQSFGSSLGNIKGCALGDIATTSFFPSKPLGGFGDGGAIFTNNDEEAEILRSLRVHGKGENKYENIRLGYNSRLDTLQAAFLLERLLNLNQEVLYRQSLADDLISCLPSSLIKQNQLPESQSAWAQFSLVTEDREHVISTLKEHGIPSMIYYPKPIHKQPVYSFSKGDDLDFPNSKYLSDHILSIPIFVRDVDIYLNKVSEAFNKLR